MELVDFIISVSGALVILLLAIIGYFMRKQIAVTEGLTASVNALNTTVQVMRNNESNMLLNCSSRHSVVDRRFDAHSERDKGHLKAIEDLKRDILVLKERMK